MKVLLVSATYNEIEPFVERLEKKVVQNNLYSGKINLIDFDCLYTGVGIAATTYYLTKHLQNNKYNLIVNAGIAGIYNPELEIGDIVNVQSDCFADLGIDDNGVFRNVFEEKFQAPSAFPFQNGWLINSSDYSFTHSLPNIKGITVNTATGRIERIGFLKEKYNPDIETMEGAAFMYTCLMESVKFIQLRSISNIVEPRNKKNWNISLAIKNLNSALIDIFTMQNFKI